MNKKVEEVQKKLLESLKGINEEKAATLEGLRKVTQTPSIESLDAVLKHIDVTFKELDHSSPEYKMLVSMTHKMAAVLDLPFGEIKAVFDKHGILPPEFKEED